MGNSEILNKLVSDPFFGFRFAIDNNFVGLANAIKQVTGISVNSPDIAYQTLVTMLKEGRKEQIQKIYDLVSYNNSADNYTGGMKDWFMSKTPALLQPNTTSGRISFEGVLAGIGAGLNAFVTFSQFTSGQTATQQQIEEEKKKEEEKKRKQMILWITLVFLFLIIVFIIIYFATQKKKP